MGTNRGSWWLDLLAVGIAAVIPVVVVVTDTGSTPVRLLVAVPLVLLFPGYALVAAFFPESREAGEPPFTDDTGRGIDKPSRHRFRGLSGIDRLGVSVAASAALVPAVALAQFLRSDVILAPQLAIGLGMVTWAFVCMALARRLRLPPENRFAVAPSSLGPVYARYFRSNGEQLSDPLPYEATTSRQVALNVLLVAAFLLAVTTAGFAFVQPPPSQEYEALAVLTQNESGEYVADDYPDDLPGADPLYVSVTNNRETTQQYELRGSLEVVDADGSIDASDDQFRTVVELAPGERRVFRHQPDDSLDGERLRLKYRLFRQTDDGAEQVRSVHVWISHPGEAGATTAAGDDTSDETPPTGPADPG